MRTSGRKVAAIAVILLCICITLPRKALAYLDPGTGSYLFQVLIAVGLGAIFMVKTYWSRIKQFLSKKREQDDK
jgi:hypothetical protein